MSSGQTLAHPPRYSPPPHTPGRFLSLVVGTGGAAVPLQLGEPLREWVFAPDLEPYRRLGGRTIVERVIQTLERVVRGYRGSAHEPSPDRTRPRSGLTDSGSRGRRRVPSTRVRECRP